MYSSSHLERQTRWSDPTSLASLAAGEEGVAAAHPKAIREGVMTAPGWEGERAQECIAASFQTTAAAKRLSAHQPRTLPHHALPCPHCGLADSRLPHDGGELGTPTAGSM